MWQPDTQGFIYSNDMPEIGMMRAVSPEFGERLISSLPHNLYFWCYNETDRCFEAIHARSHLKGLKIKQIARPLCAVPQLYAPFKWEGKIPAYPVAT